MNRRAIKLIAGLLLVALIYVGRLAYIQIFNQDFTTLSQHNSLTYVDIQPPRGLIYDRNGNILVDNKFSYDLMATPKDIGKFDTTLFCSLLGVEREAVEKKLEEFRRNRRRIGYQTVVMFKNIPVESYSRFHELRWNFQGFSLRVNTMRKYPYNAGGALLGYISEVSASDLKSHPDYKQGSMIGKTGIEAVRDEELRGKVGYSIYLRDSKNKLIGSYEEGKKDLPAVPGKDIVTTIDAYLQNYAQELMKNKRGSLVAIEPSTGEILTLVSSPTISVDDLANIGQVYSSLLADVNRPMFNRAVQASYPPGSVFKTVNGLIGLQEGVVTPSTRYPCHKGYNYSRTAKLGCHEHRSPLDFEEAIMMSCNAYFCYVYKDLIENSPYGNSRAGFDKWREYVMSFGFGSPLGSDFPYELGGNIPSGDYFDRIYGVGSWRSSNIISLSIGQGEIGCTPLHLANLCATIANRGHYIIPHIVKDSPNIRIDDRYREKHYTMIEERYFDYVVEGMSMAVNSGYGSGATAPVAAVPGLEICGKTGTAENPHGAEHSVFMCFAPRENPKIAVIAYIENGGFGASVAAPIASLVVEKYLNGEISDGRKWLENNMLNLSFMERYGSVN
ncbi:MAG: penicillin-binding protein 2 [Bacteroidales bacterium]|nr:penicillin-binding protein 2 [Bacteroidales bacterium]